MLQLNEQDWLRYQGELGPILDWLCVRSYEWLDDESLQPRISAATAARQLRLFAIACCRRWWWPLLTDVRSRQAVDIAEGAVMGQVDEEARVAAAGKAFDAVMRFEVRRTQIGLATASREEDAARSAFDFVAWNSSSGEDAARRSLGLVDRDVPVAVLCGLLRCMVGNPFRSGGADPSWVERNDGAVLGLARSIDADRAFDLMPVLGDALEEAGCAEPAILSHCRSGGPHGRGCWVVDSLLGRR